MKDITALAVREAKATANRDKAEQAWRRAWWETTLALAEVEGKDAVSQAVTEVATTLGLSRTYVQHRRTAGAVFKIVNVASDVYDLAPTVAFELVRDGKIREITPRIVEQIRQAEKDGKGKRETIAEITGTAYRDQPEGVSEKAVNEIMKAQPEKVAKAVAEQMADPTFRKKVLDKIEDSVLDRVATDPTYAARLGKAVTEVAPDVVAEQVVSTPRGRKAIQEATEEHSAKVAEWDEKAKKTKEQAKEEGKNRRQDLVWMDVNGLLFEARKRINEALEQSKAITFQFDADGKDLLLGDLDKIAATIDLFRLGLTGEITVDWDAEFEKITGGDEQ